MGADVDGGYIDTARMVVETAICLYNIKDQESADTVPLANDSAPFGILTPGCVGDALVEHLKKTGTTIQVGSTFSMHS